MFNCIRMTYIARKRWINSKNQSFDEIAPSSSHTYHLAHAITDCDLISDNQSPL